MLRCWSSFRGAREAIELVPQSSKLFKCIKLEQMLISLIFGQWSISNSSNVRASADIADTSVNFRQYWSFKLFSFVFCKPFREWIVDWHSNSLCSHSMGYSWDKSFVLEKTSWVLPDWSGIALYVYSWRIIWRLWKDASLKFWEASLNDGLNHLRFLLDICILPPFYDSYTF